MNYCLSWQQRQTQRYYAKGNKPDKARRITHALTYTWNLKSKTNAQSKQRVTDTGNKHGITSGERPAAEWTRWKKSRGTRLQDRTDASWGRDAQQGESKQCRQPVAARWQTVTSLSWWSFWSAQKYRITIPSAENSHWVLGQLQFKNKLTEKDTGFVVTKGGAEGGRIGWKQSEVQTSS